MKPNQHVQVVQITKRQSGDGSLRGERRKIVSEAVAVSLEFATVELQDELRRNQKRDHPNTMYQELNDGIRSPSNRGSLNPCFLTQEHYQRWTELVSNFLKNLLGELRNDDAGMLSEGIVVTIEHDRSGRG